MKIYIYLKEMVKIKSVEIQFYLYEFLNREKELNNKLRASPRRALYLLLKR